MSSLFKKFSILFCIVILSACSKTAIRQNAKFHQQWETQYSAAVLPADVGITLMQIDGDNQPIEKEEIYARKYIVDTVKTALHDKDFIIKDYDFDEAMELDTDLQHSLEELRASKKEFVKNKMQTLLPKEEAFAINDSIGTEINQFADLVDTDILVLIDYKGFKKSGGLVARDVAITAVSAALLQVGNVQPDSGGMAIIMLIDGNTGEILWASAGGSYDTFLSSGRDDHTRLGLHIKNAVDRALKELPNKTLSEEEYKAGKKGSWDKD